MSSSQEALRQLDESPISGFQLKTVVTAGMGFFTDAYDLFIIGVVSSILKETWHITSLQTLLLSSVALLASVLGAFVFGRIADTKGRKFIYGYELLVLAAGATASALSPSVIWLLVFRFILGVGIGGDYPVSSTLMSEYANRKDRGKLITFVFSTQALGLIIGPLLTYIFTEWGPNVTTFLYPAEIFPVTVRTTAHGFAAGLGKFGAFIGAFIFPLMLNSTAFKLPGAMGVAAGICVLGFLLTFVLPEPKQKSLETIEQEGEQMDERHEQKSAGDAHTSETKPSYS